MTAAIEPHRILVVDDMEDLHEVFRRLLVPRRVAAELASLEASLFGGGPAVQRDVPFEVECASQGQQGVERVQAALDAGRRFAMAFVDMRMPPGWDGLETIEEIWRVDPDVEVVICSAFSDHTDRDIAARLGPTDQVLFLRKPFDAIEVRQLARALTTKWALRQQARLHLRELERKLEGPVG